MKCWRIDLQRKLVYYLSKELNNKDILKVETHLLDCGYCRSNLAKLHTGQAFIEQLKPVPASDPWEQIEAAITKEPVKQDLNRAYFNKLFLKPNLKAAMWFVGGVLLSGALFTSVWNLKSNPHLEEPEIIDQESFIKYEEPEFSSESFRLVAIDEMHTNTEPHIVTQGYVSEIKIDPDGDTTFKLVEKIGTSEPFIICEIIDPIKLPSPKIGSKVKVYGVSRYDEKVNHQWYEVHPVLNIELVKNNN
jgi:hypothetical protein